MKNSIQDSFKLLRMLKQFVLNRGRMYKLYLPVMRNNYIVSKFIQINNHRIPSNVALSYLLDALLENVVYDSKTARRN